MPLITPRCRPRWRVAGDWFEPLERSAHIAVVSVPEYEVVVTLDRGDSVLGSVATFDRDSTGYPRPVGRADPLDVVDVGDFVRIRPLVVSNGEVNVVLSVDGEDILDDVPIGDLGLTHRDHPCVLNARRRHGSHRASSRARPEPVEGARSRSPFSRRPLSP